MTRSFNGEKRRAGGRPLMPLLLALLLFRTGFPVFAIDGGPASVASCPTPGGGLAQVCALELGRLRIAVVKSVFTDSPYAYYPASSFYAFYRSADAQNIVDCTSENIRWLSSRVVDDWGKYGQSLNEFVQSSIHDRYFNPSLTEVVTDIQVGNGSLYAPGGLRKYDVAIVGFSEYVTATEYEQMKKFVATGGLLVILSPAFFRAEVWYDPITNTEQLVSGHGWSFDGNRACHGLDSRWHDDNIDWLGGDYCCFYTSGFEVHGATLNPGNPVAQMLRDALGRDVILTEYRAHESTALLNLTDTDIVATWNLSNMSEPLTVDMYAHHYGRGAVFVSGVFGTDIIASSAAMQLAVYGAMLYLGPGGPAVGTTLTNGGSSTFASRWGHQASDAAILLGSAAVGVLAAASLAYWSFKRRTGRHAAGADGKNN